jgi:PAP_fibrillin
LEDPVESRKRQLLEAVSYTSNGKSATPEQQAEVLSLVRSLEADFPPSPTLLTDLLQAKEILDGPWYLQYTSPGTVGDEDRFPDAWKPRNAQEGDANIETTPFAARGSVSAAGIPVETANRVVVQTLDVDQSRVTNDIGLEWGRLVAGGTFRPSPTVPNRALVSFDTFQFRFNGGFSFDVGFLFPIVKAIQRSQENGWLETTFVDKDVRIGRGNKGTMFVLTRRQDAVKP